MCVQTNYPEIFKEQNKKLSNLTIYFISLNFKQIRLTFFYE